MATTKKSAKQAQAYVDPLGPLTRTKMSLLDAADELREHLHLPRQRQGLWDALESMTPVAAQEELARLLGELQDLVPRLAPPVRRLRAVGERCPF